MRSLYNIRHDGRLFLMLAKFPMELHTAGQLFVSAFMTAEQAAQINESFPQMVFLANS